jgi:hypothetical protein
MAHYTALRPDGWVLLDDGSEYILELTVPWEENFDHARDRKRAKYDELLRYRQSHNIRTTLITFEVGARGKLNASTLELSWLFRPENHKLVRKMREDMVTAALKSSFHIYCMRHAAVMPGVRRE